MDIETKTAINIEVACDPEKIIAALAPDQQSILVGVLYGNAVDFMQRANPAGGRPFKGFAGAFEVIPTITDENIGGSSVGYSSGGIFLPSAFSTVVDAALTKVLYPNAEKPEKKARGAIDFAALIYLARSQSGDGFAWGMEWLKEPAPIDPLAPMKSAYADTVTAKTTKPGVSLIKADVNKPEAAPAPKGKGK